MSIDKIKFGWKADSPDPRDYHLQIKEAPEIRTISLFDTHNTPPVYDQGHLGSCVSNALAGIVEFKLMNKSPVAQPIYHLYQPSRLFNYFFGRKIEGTINSDSGLRIRDGIKALAKKGISDEHLWPYDITKFKEKPSDHALSEGEKFKIGTYRRTVPDTASIVGSIEQANPIIFGFMVFESFMTREVERTGVIPIPDPRKERLLGGHAVDIWGYNAEGDYALCRNSWGKDWGINGYFHMPMAYLQNSTLASDFWIIDNLKDF